MCHGGESYWEGLGEGLGDRTPSLCCKHHGQVSETCLPGVVLFKAIDKEGFLSFKCLLISPWSSRPLSLFWRGTTPDRQGGVSHVTPSSLPLWLQLWVPGLCSANQILSRLSNLGLRDGDWELTQVNDCFSHLQPGEC